MRRSASFEERWQADGFCFGGGRSGGATGRSSAWWGWRAARWTRRSAPAWRSAGGCRRRSGGRATPARRRGPGSTHGFAALGLAEIVAFTDPNHARSLAVMRRIGMRPDPARRLRAPGDAGGASAAAAGGLCHRPRDMGATRAAIAMILTEALPCVTWGEESATAAVRARARVAGCGSSSTESAPSAGQLRLHWRSAEQGADRHHPRPASRSDQGKWPSHADAAQHDRTCPSSPALATLPRSTFGLGDAILLTMKSQDTVAALERLRAAGVSKQPIFCVQNGVANERFALRVSGGFTA